MKKGGKRRVEGSAELGQQLREIRLERSLTQRELATLVGISPAHVSAIETGKVTNPGIELVQRIASVLEACIFLGREAPRGKAASRTLAYESPFDLEADPTGVVQSTLTELLELLEDRTLPVSERAQIAERLLSYAKWQRDCSLKRGTTEP